MISLPRQLATRPKAWWSDLGVPEAATRPQAPQQRSCMETPASWSAPRPSPPTSGQSAGEGGRARAVKNWDLQAPAFRRGGNARGLMLSHHHGHSTQQLHSTAGPQLAHISQLEKHVSLPSSAFRPPVRRWGVDAEAQPDVPRRRTVVVIEWQPLIAGSYFFPFRPHIPGTAVAGERFSRSSQPLSPLCRSRPGRRGYSRSVLASPGGYLCTVGGSGVRRGSLPTEVQ